MAPATSEPVLQDKALNESAVGAESSQTVGPGSKQRSSGDGRQPKKLGQFEIRAFLGGGAFGRVYRAFDAQLQREVALKVPQPGLLDDPNAVTRFLREAQAAAKLQHPHIVPVFDTGRDGKTDYIAAAYIDGQPLSDVSDDQPLEPHRAASIVRKLADALDYAHRQGILHRDIKPDNIMLDAADEPHLMDFGLARFEGSEEKLTRDGAVLGTPAYMSPEQCSTTQSENLTGAADQYSLGAVLYELLTGQTPFSGPTPIQIHNHLHSEPPRPTSVNPAIPRDLETICLKALAKEPDKRYADCAALADDLRRWEQQLPIAARRIGPAERFVRWSRRNPLAAGLTGLTMVLLLVTALVSAVGYVKTSAALSDAEMERQRADDEARRVKSALSVAETERQRADEEARRVMSALLAAEAERARADEEAQRVKAALLKAETESARADVQAKRATTEASRATAALRDANRNLYYGQILLARNDFDNNIITRGRVLLDQCPRELRHWEWGYLQNLYHQESRSFDGPTGRVWSVAFSPNGRQIVSAGKTISLRDAETGRELQTFSSPGGAVYSVSFSPKGRRIISGNQDQTITIWDVKTGKVLRTLAGHAAPVSSVAYSSNGRQIASGSFDQTIRIWDAETGREIRTLRGQTDPRRSGPVSNVAFSPDGRLIVSKSGGSHAIKVWLVKTGLELWTLGGAEGGARSGDCNVSFSPDGRMIASGIANNTTIKIWTARTGRELRTLTGHTGPVTSVVFGPNGKQIVSGSLDQTIKIWNTATGRMLRTYAGHSCPVRCIALRPDGKRIVSCSTCTTDPIRLWNVETGPELQTLEGHAGSVTAVVFSLDGHRLASGGRDGKLELWNADTGRKLRTLKESTPEVRSVAFRPDGKQIVSGGGSGGAGQIQLWDVETGRKLRTLDGHTGLVQSVAFSPDGRRIVSGSGDKTARLWDAATGRVLRIFTGHTLSINSVAFSPDGRRIVSASRDRTIRLWNTETGQQLRMLSGHTEGVHSVAFSPDGRWIVSASADKSIKLWDAKTGRQLRMLNGHTNEVFSVVFSPDGQRIVSASADKTIRLWDADGGHELLTLSTQMPVGGPPKPPHRSPRAAAVARQSARKRPSPQKRQSIKPSPQHAGKNVYSRCVVFSPDGTRIVGGFTDGAIRIYDSRPYFTGVKQAASGLPKTK